MMTQQSSLELCFATSWPVSLFFCVSLLLWFIVAIMERSRSVCYIRLVVLDACIAHSTVWFANKKEVKNRRLCQPAT